MIKKIILSLFATIYFVLLFANTDLSGGEKKMEPLYDLQQTETMKPYVYDVGFYYLFPVPRANAVATNTYDNAITVLTFTGDRFGHEKYFKDIYKYMGSGAIVIPPVSQDVIGLGQSRRFTLFNLRNNTFKYFRICSAIEETIEQIAIADAKKLHFIFEIRKYSSDSINSREYTSPLRLIDLSGAEPKRIKEIENVRRVNWFVNGDKLFMFRFKENELKVLTTHFEPAYHPLQDFLTRNKGKIDTIGIEIHPTLPFAILSGGDSGTVLVSWGKDRWGDILIKPFNNDTQGFSFSPDGKWVVFKRYVGGKVEYNTYIAPISEKYPYFIGTPIKILDKDLLQETVVWTSNPTSYVGVKSSKTYRWELTTAAHPESTKPDFHEFIVERDLERLTKEKKQGLGVKN